jgi:hypothetical protein
MNKQHHAQKGQRRDSGSVRPEQIPGPVILAPLNRFSLFLPCFVHANHVQNNL